jgi:hypothetical protein
MFAPEMPIKGNILFFDLDVVIFDNIDPLFSHPGKFNIIRDFNRCRVKDWKLSNSSCMRWQAGTMDYLWTEFKDRSAQIMQQNHGDQDWITKRAAGRHHMVSGRVDKIIQVGDDRIQRYKIIDQGWT